MKKRTLFLVCASFICGMYALSVFDGQLLLNISIITILALIMLVARKRDVRKTILPLVMVLAFSIGSLRYESANNIQSKPLYMYENATVQTVAEVISVPKVAENNISYFANLYSVVDGEEHIPINEKARFVYYIDETNRDKEIIIPTLGDCISTNGKIKIPKDSMNSGGFDYARYLKTENIFFICEVELDDYAVTEHRNRFFRHKIEKFRQKCMEFIDEAFPLAEAGILKAFLIGDGNGITEETDIAFTKSGMSHILAVSGLHVSVFLSAIVSILKCLKVSKRKERIICVVGAAMFVIFTGAQTSAIRAGTMAVLALVAKMLYRKADPLTSISVAAVVLSLINPHVIYDGGFMLSFSATAGIILFYENFNVYMSNIYKNINTESKLYKHLRSACESVAVGTSAQIFTIPLLVYMFNGFSLMSIIATMIVSQFLKYLLIGGLLFLLVSFISVKVAVLISFPVRCLTRAMLFVAEICSGFPFSQVFYGVLTPFTILLYALLICVIISAIKKKKVIYTISLSSLCILSFLGIVNYSIHFNLASVSFLNVGQGDCALIKAPGDCDILIDAGGYSMNEKTGEYIISPYLLKNGVTDIEYVMISHVDSDHTIGLSGILKTHKIHKLIIPYGQQYSENYQELAHMAEKHSVEILLFTSGDKLKINDKMSVVAVTPDIEQYKYSRKLNDTGMVLRLDYGESSFLFSGDISSTIEKYLLKEEVNINDIDVLKVAHHGSKNSTCQEFLDAVNPEYAFISVGKNSYGHPDSEIIRKLSENGTQVYISNIHKDVTFYFDDCEMKGVKYSEFRARE